MQAREQLLEGFLRRLAASPDADAFALRGGMLVRTWIGASRPVRDADFACSLPCDVRDLRPRVRAILAAHVADGVTFDAERFRIDTFDNPHFTLFAAGTVDGKPAEIAIDISFGLDIWPAAERRTLVLARGTAALWTCPHEMVIATKLGVIGELGPHRWRAKDLADVWAALRRFSRTRSLGDAIERRAGHTWQQVLAASWWRDSRAAMRWARAWLPMDLDVVVGEVRAMLAPFARRP